MRLSLAFAVLLLAGGTVIVGAATMSEERGAIVGATLATLSSLAGLTIVVRRAQP